MRSTRTRCYSTTTFLRQLASSEPSIKTAFEAAVRLNIFEGAEALQKVFAARPLPDQDLKWFNGQLAEVRKVLTPVVRDPELPDWLSESRWGVTGAF
jgi:hypothetical protein